MVGAWVAVQDGQVAAQTAAPSTKQHWLAVLHPVSAQVMADPKTPAILGQHFQYLKGQFAAGKLLLAGPRRDGVYGIVVLEVGSEEEAKQIMGNDPCVKAGVFRLETHQVRLPLLCGRPAPNPSGPVPR